MRKNLQKPPETGRKSGENSQGRLAFSLAGRDSGRYFITVGVYDENHLLLADGSLRKIENPKKKKLRHIKLLSFCAPELQKKLAAGKPVLNAELRNAIAAYKENPDSPGGECGRET